jgi:hypothetical protein
MKTVRHVVACTVLLLGASAQAAPMRVAILPLRDSNPGAGDAGPIEAALLDAVRSTASLQLVNFSNGKLHGSGAPPHELRASAVARESGAERVLGVEIARLADDRVVYLQAIDAGGRPLASTTVNVPSGPIAVEKLQGAVVRLLDPAHWVGRVRVHVDVPRAELQVDGKPRAGTIELAVGTHALRVTHPAYRDFLRFVDVEFGRTVELEVALSAFPLTEGEMNEQRRRAQARARVPWWRSWWALGAAAGVVTAVTAGAIWGARPGVPAVDHTTIYQAPRGP